MAIVVLPPHPNDCTYAGLCERASAFVAAAPALTSSEELGRAWENVSRGFFNLRAEGEERRKAGALVQVLSRQFAAHEGRLARIHFTPKAPE